MLLTSPSYFAFLAIVFFGYWLLLRFRLAGVGVVIVANLFFYARWDFIYLAIIPAASILDYWIGRGLGIINDSTARRMLVGISILINVSLIASLKYLPLMNGAWGWTLPLGLSFYAFQSMTYTIDIYRRDAKPTHSLTTYLCCSTFFPTTIAGPITRIATLIPQFEKERLLTATEGGRALFLLGMGITKKFLIADFLAENLINRVFDTPGLYSGGETLVAVFAYAFQLFYDFSGYTDIALGSALLLGIRLPANFNRPYSAENIADFWRRWHISLSNWLRDYLYFSLPGLRSKWKIFTYSNLVITMAIGGLWHGASWTFLVWGLLHGFALAGLRWWQTLRGNPKPSTAFASRVARGALTFGFVTFAWIFFRAPNLTNALEIFSRIGSLTFSFTNVTLPYALILGIAVGAHYVPKRLYDASLRIYSASPSFVQAGAMAALVFAIYYVAVTGAAPFIYSRF